MSVCLHFLRLNLTVLFLDSRIDPRTHKRSHTPNVVQGRGVWWTPLLLAFRYVRIFRKDFTFSRKPVMCSTRSGSYYGLPRCLGPVTSSKIAAILGAILDFTQKLEIVEKRQNLEHFDAGHEECAIIKHFAALCWHFLHFSPKKCKKNTHFSSKMAWPPATYDVIFRNHSNRFWPNLCQNVSKGYSHSYWKLQVYIIFGLGKVQVKPYWGIHPPPLPPCTPEG